MKTLKLCCNFFQYCLYTFMIHLTVQQTARLRKSKFWLLNMAMPTFIPSTAYCDLRYCPRGTIHILDKSILKQNILFLDHLGLDIMRKRQLCSLNGIVNYLTAISLNIPSIYFLKILSFKLVRSVISWKFDNGKILIVEKYIVKIVVNINYEIYKDKNKIYDE